MVTLYDQHDRPIVMRDLKKDYDAITVPLKRSDYRVPMATKFGRLEPSQISSIFQSADDGKFQDLIDLSNSVIKADTHIFSVYNKLVFLVLELIRSVPPTDSDKESVKVADFLLGVAKAPQFTRLLKILLSGTRNGFAVAEILWRFDGKYVVPRDYREVNLRTLRYEPESPVGLVIGKDYKTTEPLAPWKFVIHKDPINGDKFYEGGLMRPAIPLFMGKSWMVNFWLGLGDRFGHPIPIVYYPKGSSDDEKEELFDMVRGISHEFAAALTEGTKLEMHSPANLSGNVDIFTRFIDMFIREISKIFLGQTMTTEDGSSLSQAQIHKDEQTALLTARAQNVCHTIVSDLFLPLVRMNFGIDVPVPDLVVSADVQEDLKMFTESLIPWVDRGQPVEPGFIADKFKYTLPNPGVAVLGPMAKQNNSQQMELGQSTIDPFAQTAKTVRSAELNAAAPAKGRTDPLDAAIEEMLPELNDPVSAMVEGIIADVENAESSVDLLGDLDEKVKLRMENLRKVLAAANFVGMTVGDSLDA